MPVRRIGIRLESLNEPIKQAITTAARLGAAAVEFDAVGELAPDVLSQTGRRHLVHLITTHGMILSAVGFPTRRGYDSLDRLENRVAATLVALRFASAIGAPMVINQIGRIPAERRDTAGKHFFEAMDAIGREAERVGVRFAIETGADGPETLGKFLAEQANHGLAVNYDPANLLVRGHNVYNGVAALVHHIIGLHVKDAVRTGTTVSGFQEVPLGEGELDWPQLFNLLDEVGYRGVYTIERESGDQRERDIIRAVEYLRKF